MLELVKGIKRVKIKSPKPALSKANKEFLTGLAASVEDVNRYQRGETELQSWSELYHELQAEEAPADAERLLRAIGLGKPDSE